MDITTSTDIGQANLRLLHLVSPSLPVGAFTYSQGLEWAVECGWINDSDALRDWVGDLLRSAMTDLDVPVLARLYHAADSRDLEGLAYWSRYLIASRETRELREEEANRGRALASLLPELGVPLTSQQLSLVKGCQLTGFALAAHRWHIPLRMAAQGYVWGWLENIVLAGIKIIPLGQTAGQRLIAELTGEVVACVDSGLVTDDEDIGASCTAQAIASSLHEIQYTRIYRS